MYIDLVQLYGMLQPPNAEPLSVEILASALLETYPELNCDIHTLDVRNGQVAIHDLAKKIVDKKSKIIGISVPQSTYQLSFDLINLLRKDCQNSSIILGHSLPTHLPENFLNYYPELLIVRGWGEETFVQLVEHLIERNSNLGDIPNLCYIENNQIQFTPPQWPSKIRKPLRQYAMDFFPRVESSRGCHHDICTFCTRLPRAKRGGSVWVKRPVDDVMDDIQSLVSSGKTYFTFTDEDFIGSDLDNAIQLARALRQFQGIRFSLSVRADNVKNPHGSSDENAKRLELFEELRKAGLYLVFIGVESLSNSQLKRYGKGITATDSIVAAQLIQYLGVEIELGYILFDPLMSRQELLENVDRLDESGLWTKIGWLFNHLRPQVDTAYLRHMENRGLKANYNSERMHYQVDHIYVDDSVRFIAEFTRAWTNPLEEVYILVRNIGRTTQSASIYTHFIWGIRLLFFRILKWLVYSDARKTSDLDQIVLIGFNLELRGLLKSIKLYLLSKQPLSETEVALKIECDKLLQSKEWVVMGT